MRKLIINGDDFGFNREITDGILDSHRRGILTSTTLMTNMPAAEYAAEESKKHSGLSVGIHLNLTLGKPLSGPDKVPALVGPDGNFYGHRRLFSLANRFQLPSEQVEREFTAQIEKFLSFGIVPSHCDSHHHAGACLQTFPIKIKLLEKYNIKKLRTHRGFYRPDKTCPQRLRVLLNTIKINARKLPNRLYYELQHLYCKFKGFHTPDVRYGFSKVVSTPPLKFDIEGWEKFIKNMPDGVVEFCVHPGFANDDPLDRPEFREQRVIEHKMLIEPACKDIYQEHKIELINFNEL